MARPREGIKILLVEDQPLEGNLLKAAFEERNFHPLIYTAEDAVEAWQFLKGAKYSTVPLPDAILVNLQDPQEVGELVEDIKRDPVFSEIPLIAIASETDDDLVFERPEVGPVQVLRKGVDLDGLFALVDRIEETVTSPETVSPPPPPRKRPPHRHP